MIPLVVQTNENHLELSLDCIADLVTIPSPSIQFSVLSDRCCVVKIIVMLTNDTFLEANLVAFCRLLVVIDHTVTQSKSAFTLRPRDIKFTRTTHCLSQKTQTIPLPADEFLRTWCRHVLPLHWSPLAFWHMMMNPCLITPTFHSYILQLLQLKIWLLFSATAKDQHPLFLSS